MPFLFDSSKLFDQAMRAVQFFDIDTAWIKEKNGIEVTAATQSGMQLQHPADFFA